jgi:hypothetical protein
MSLPSTEQTRVLEVREAMSTRNFFSSRTKKLANGQVRRIQCCCCCRRRQVEEKTRIGVSLLLMRVARAATAACSDARRKM